MNRNIKDSFNLLSKLTWPRVWNGVKVLSSYYVARMIKKPVHWGLPISISIEPTTSCNLRCPQCPSGLREFTRPTGMLQNDVLKKVIDELHTTLAYITFYFQGEPYLNKNFLEYVKYASERKIYTATSTNAHYLDEETAKKTVTSGLDRLIISIDGVDQESYAKYRVGGNLEKVILGTRNIVEWKKKMNSSTPHIIWQFIVFRHNENQIDQIKLLGSEIGVDEVAIKTAQIYDYKQGNELIPQNEKYSRYSGAGITYRIKNKLLNHCWRMWQGCVITWDGKIVPCCFDKDGSYQLGGLNETSFRSIWRGDKYNTFRRLIQKSRKEVDICANCTEGTKVWEL
ncbi:MAG: radical SAM/SPASM domain-containing protein [Bacteroidia bacterium]